jgi:hypothetical protein
VVHPLLNKSLLGDVGTREVEVLAKGADVLEHGGTIVKNNAGGGHEGELAEGGLGLGSSTRDILSSDLVGDDLNVGVLGSDLDSLDNVDTVGLVSVELLNKERKNKG